MRSILIFILSALFVSGCGDQHGRSKAQSQAETLLSAYAAWSVDNPTQGAHPFGADPIENNRKLAGYLTSGKQYVEFIKVSEDGSIRDPWGKPYLVEWDQDNQTLTIRSKGGKGKVEAATPDITASGQFPVAPK